MCRAHCCKLKGLSRGNCHFRHKKSIWRPSIFLDRSIRFWRLFDRSRLINSILTSIFTNSTCVKDVKSKIHRFNHHSQPKPPENWIDILSTPWTYHTKSAAQRINQPKCLEIERHPFIMFDDNQWEYNETFPVDMFWGQSMLYQIW